MNLLKHQIEHVDTTKDNLPLQTKVHLLNSVHDVIQRWKVALLVVKE
jgi:hypothetical protein